MNVYVMRHGTTVWNERGITQGRTNNRLSQRGKTLTEEVSLKYKDIKFDIIYCSPLMRTMQTANIMNKYHNVKIIKDERLIEINQGVFTGRERNSLTDEERKSKYARDEKCGMESYQSVYKRVGDFINELRKNKCYDNVLIITHNIGASLIEDIFEDIKVDFNNYKNLSSFNNAQVKCFHL